MTATNIAKEAPLRSRRLLFDLAMSPVQRSPQQLLDQVRRNVERAEALGALEGISFECGCQLTLAGGAGGKQPWRVMAWNDSRCCSATHRALRAKWEGTNLL